ncbi:hypothetical protein AYI70_g5547 [Smittium culicis]|uniref:Uncharacterized protein n=1 Tax=Smittium culicis TaxID=133412 RepID=A0A1R1XTZ4_9FUNG|nr:hypothetical protein AYI70_g5547 [Smittium culicis]
MRRGSDSLPKGWYWEVQPAKFVYEQFLPVKRLIVCPNVGCKAKGGFIKDSNGTNRNQKANFRCGACRDRYNVRDFYVEVLKGDEGNLPAETGWETFLPVPSSPVTTDPCQLVTVDIGNKAAPGDSTDLAIARPETLKPSHRSSGIKSFPSVAQIGDSNAVDEVEIPGDLILSDTEMLSDSEYEAVMKFTASTSEHFRSFTADTNKATASDPVPASVTPASAHAKKPALPPVHPSVLFATKKASTSSAKSSVPKSTLHKSSELLKPGGSKGKHRASLDFPHHDLSSYLDNSLAPNTHPSKNIGITIRDQSNKLKESIGKNLMDYSLGGSLVSNKRNTSPPTRSPKRHHTLDGNNYVTNEDFNDHMELHVKNMQEIIKANRSEDLLKIKKLEDENFHLKELLVIQTKKIDRLTHQSQGSTQTANQTVQPPSASVVSTPAPPITFNFGASKTVVSAHPPALTIKKLSYSEIAKSQSKNDKEAELLTKSIRKLVGTKPINSGTRAEKNHKLARIYVQGIARQPVKDVKECLFNMRFQLTRIHNMDFIGKRMLEFTVSEEYAPAFCARVKTFEFLKLMPKVKPDVPMDKSANDDVKAACKAAYIARLNKSIENSKKPEMVQFMIELLAEIEANPGPGS